MLGHAGDGNLHPIIAYTPGDEGNYNLAQAANKAIVKTVIEMGGTATGEHRVGIGKRQSMASIATMGVSNEMEYQIAMENGTLTLAVTSIVNRFTIPYWPQTLEDDCRLSEVGVGDPPESVQFDIDAWVTVLAAPTSE
jgi:hypothetical protein